MRDKSIWKKEAIFADILYRLGKKLADESLWEKYIFIYDSISPGCELGEKAAKLLFFKKEIRLILQELDNFYLEYKNGIIGS